MREEIERLTQERDNAREMNAAYYARAEKAEAACAVMRAALEAATHHIRERTFERVKATMGERRNVLAAGDDALATDAGRGLMEVAEGMAAALQHARVIIGGEDVVDAAL